MSILLSRVKNMAAGGSSSQQGLKHNYRFDVIVSILDVPARMLPMDVTISLTRSSKMACTPVMHLVPESKGRCQSNMSFIGSLRHQESGAFDSKIYKARVNQVRNSHSLPTEICSFPTLFSVKRPFSHVSVHASSLA
jgi:hypothetical protein